MIYNFLFFKHAISVNDSFRILVEKWGSVVLISRFYISFWIELNEEVQKACFYIKISQEEKIEVSISSQI